MSNVPIMPLIITLRLVPALQKARSHLLRVPRSSTSWTWHDCFSRNSNRAGNCWKILWIDFQFVKSSLPLWIYRIGEKSSLYGIHPICLEQKSVIFWYFSFFLPFNWHECVWMSKLVICLDCTVWIKSWMNKNQNSNHLYPGSGLVVTHNLDPGWSTFKSFTGWSSYKSFTSWMIII